MLEAGAAHAQLIQIFVLQLAGANRPIALANANAMLRRVDLICEVIVSGGVL